MRYLRINEGFNSMAEGLKNLQVFLTLNIHSSLTVTSKQVRLYQAEYIFG